MKIQETIQEAIEQKRELMFTFNYAGLDEIKNRFQPYILGTDSSKNVFVWGIFATNTKPKMYFLQNIKAAQYTETTFELKDGLFYLQDEEEVYAKVIDGFTLSATPPPAPEKKTRTIRRQPKAPKLSRIAECSLQLERAYAEIENLRKAVAEKDKTIAKMKRAATFTEV